MAQLLEVLVSDGFAFAHGGDTAVIVYKSSARLQRIRWIFDRIEELAARAGPSRLQLRATLGEIARRLECTIG